jgi:hypothetical protein
MRSREWDERLVGEASQELSDLLRNIPNRCRCHRNDRFGSKPVLMAPNHDFRSTPNNGHHQTGMSQRCHEETSFAAPSARKSAPRGSFNSAGALH